MKTIARFQVPEEAHLFRSFLVSREIAAYVFDEHLVQIAWSYSDAIGGVRVMVGDSDGEVAVESYLEYMNALRAEPMFAADVRAWPLVLALSYIFGGPVLLFGRRELSRPSR